jgi:hypothetical protein
MVKSARKHTGQVAAAIVPATLLTQLGMPMLAALIFLAVLVIAAICWTINSKDRSDNVSRIIFARKGDPRCLDADPAGRATKPEGPAPARRVRKTSARGPSTQSVVSARR